MPVNVIRRIEASNTLCKSWPRLVVPYGDADDPVSATLYLLNEIGIAGKTIGLESDAWFVTPERYNLLQSEIEKAGGKVFHATRIVEEMRMIKSDAELAYIRQGAPVAENTMRIAFEASGEGSDENKVAAKVASALFGAGSEYSSLPPYLGAGPRSGMCHATWSGRAHREGDVLPYEIPAIFKRYACLLMRTASVGPSGDEIRRQVDMLKECTVNLIAAIKPGVTSGEAHTVVKTTFEKWGYAEKLGHRAAYSVGVNYPPDNGEGHIVSIRENDPQPLMKGMVLYLNPAIVEFGKYTLAFCDTTTVSETGCELITNFPKELITV